MWPQKHESWWIRYFLSNVRISEMYRCRFYDLKVYFWWPKKRLFSYNQRWNTLYLKVASQRKFDEIIIGKEFISEHISTPCSFFGLKLHNCNHAKVSKLHDRCISNILHNFSQSSLSVDVFHIQLYQPGSNQIQAT